MSLIGVNREDHAVLGRECIVGDSEVTLLSTRPQPTTENCFHRPIAV